MQIFRGLSEEACLERFHDNDTQSFSRDPQKLYVELQEKKPQIDKLKKKGVLKQDQYNLLIPPSVNPPSVNTVESSKFDITLLMVLLTNFCGFKYPMKNWIPQPTDTNTFADIVRVKRSRDEVQHMRFEVSDAEFKRIVPLFAKPLLALGVPQERIDNVLNMRIIDEETKQTLRKYEQSQTSFDHNFIPPITNFFSRDKELKELHEKLTKSVGSKLGVVLCGFPGLGKSETARQYWIEYGKSTYEDIIVWVNAENAATVESEFRDIGNECGIQLIRNIDGKNVAVKELVDLVYRHFAAKQTSSPRKVLFVFDGADDPNVLLQFLPKSIDYSPHILITSQCQDWGNRFHHVELQVFSVKKALQFFIKNTLNQYKDEEEIKILLDEISCHPLALQQVVSYMKINSMNVEGYRSLLKQNTKEMFSEGVNEVDKKSVNSILSVSINRLRNMNQDVSDLLDIFAHLDGKEIKKGFLLLLFGNDVYKLNKVLTLLRKYSIANFEEMGRNLNVSFTEQVIRIHSLTQTFIESNQTRKIFSEQLEKIANIFITDLEDCEALKKIQNGKLWLNHFNKIIETDSKKSIILNCFLDKQQLIENLFMTIGINYTNYFHICQYISEYQKQKHGEKHPAYLKAVYHFCTSLCLLDKEREAFDIIKCNADSQHAINGPLDIDFLKSKNLLGDCFEKLENYDEALRTYKEVEKAQLKTLGPTHRDYLENKHNLAQCFQSMENYEEALRIYKEVEEAQLKTLGPTHRDYLTTKHNLAQCFQSMENNEEALRIYEEVEEAQLKTLGPTHRDYLTTKHNLAHCFQSMENNEEALRIYEEVEEAELKTLGPTHRDYLTTKQNLAQCFQSMENNEEAVRIYKEVEEARLKTLGPTHRHYLTTKQNLAQCFQSMENYEEALRIYEEVEEAQLKTLGPTHRDYLTTKHNLAHCFQSMENNEEALRIYEEVEEAELKTLGPTHRDYLTTKQNLAQCFQSMENNEEAVRIYKEVEEARLKTLGPTHRHYLTTKQNLAQCFQSMENYEEALRIYEEVEEAQLKTLGPTHRDYLTTKQNLAQCFQSMENYEEALRIYEEVEEAQLKTLGPTHRDYLTTKQNLAQCFQSMENYEEALRIYEEVEEAQLKTLGPTHRDYLTTKQNLAQCFQSMENYEEALRIYEEVEEAQLKTLGQSMENYEEALRIYEEVEEAQLKTLGPTHRDYLTTKHNLAQCFQSMENYEEALRIYEDN